MSASFKIRETDPGEYSEIEKIFEAQELLDISKLESEEKQEEVQ